MTVLPRTRLRPLSSGSNLTAIISIPEEDWCANSPDLSPMDYSINGIFKQGLWKRKAQDINGLKRAMRQEWSRISKELCVKTLKSWESRVKLMLENNGLQIEHLK